MPDIEQLYAAAHAAGFLKECVWTPSIGGPPRTNMVGIAAPDETLLSGLTLSTETVMSYPASIFNGLQAGEKVTVAGVAFQVRDVKAVHDGSEMHARLTRL